ncbi:low-density lipoprotein receptor-related protein 6-like [Glandiceps talaboti]
MMGNNGKYSVRLCMWGLIALLMPYFKAVAGNDHMLGSKLFFTGQHPPFSSPLLYYTGTGQQLYNQLSSDGYINHEIIHWDFLDSSEKTALGFDYDDSLVFWSDPGHRSIYVHDLKENTTRAVFIGTSTFVEGIAVDWVANNVYWTDATYNWIKMSNYDGSFVRTLVTTELDTPTGIACDPINGYLYWSDWGETYRIERSTLSGENRSTLIDEHTYGIEAIGAPAALTMDYDNNRLFWTDSRYKRVVSLDLNSSPMIPLVVVNATDEFGDIFGIDFDPNFGFFVVDRLEGYGGIHFVPLDGEMLFSTDLFSLLDIIYYDDSRQTQKEPNPCANAVCNQLCVSDPGPTGYKCVCSHGYYYSVTESTCKEDLNIILDHELIFSAEGDYLCQLPANIGHQVLPDFFNVSCFARATMNAIDFDVNGNYIFAHSDSYNSIWRAKLQSDKQWRTIVIHTYAIAVAVDWIASNLYWTDQRDKSINIARLDGEGDTILISDGIDEPSGIAIHAVKRYLFWTDVGTSPHIERSSLNGKERKILVRSALSQPNHLAIDFNKDRLYWTDDGRHKLESTDFNGEDRNVFKSLSQNSASVGITIWQDFLFFAEKNEKQIQLYNILDVSPVRTFGFEVEPTALKFFHASLQPQPTDPNPCDLSNGGCIDGICINTDNGAECRCQKVSAICIPVLRCPMTIANGMMSDTCDNKNGQRCHLSCDEGYYATVTEAVMCTESGEWSTGGANELCREITCPLIIPNGRMSEKCDNRYGKSCDVTCESNYSPTSTEPVRCTTSGEWSTDSGDLCKLSVHCPETIPHGQMSKPCSNAYNQTCYFTCEPGYRPIIADAKVVCTISGEWNLDSKHLCIEITKPSTPALPGKKDASTGNQQTIRTSVIALAILGAIFIIGGIALVVYTLMRRRRKRSIVWQRDRQQVINNTHSTMANQERPIGGGVVGLSNPIYDVNPYGGNINASSNSTMPMPSVAPSDVNFDIGYPEKLPLDEEDTVNIEPGATSVHYAAASPPAENPYDNAPLKKEQNDTKEKLTVKLKETDA